MDINIIFKSSYPHILFLGLVVFGWALPSAYWVLFPCFPHWSKWKCGVQWNGLVWLSKVRV